jgi:hypothetical protein
MSEMLINAACCVAVAGFAVLVWALITAGISALMGAALASFKRKRRALDRGTGTEHRTNDFFECKLAFNRNHVTRSN